MNGFYPPVENCLRFTNTCFRYKLLEIRLYDNEEVQHRVTRPDNFDQLVLSVMELCVSFNSVWFKGSFEAHVQAVNLNWVHWFITGRKKNTLVNPNNLNLKKFKSSDFVHKPLIKLRRCQTENRCLVGVTALQVQKLEFINHHGRKRGRFDLKNKTQF